MPQSAGKNEHKTVCIACSVFQLELEALRASGKISLPVHYLNSMMHMQPELLNEKLSHEISDIIADGDDVLLLYGECHNYMDTVEKIDSVHRVHGCNCVEIMIGNERFNELLNDGAFFLIYEWAIRWRTIFENELDLKGQTAKDFMREMHKYLLYIDTSLRPVPEKLLNEASEYLGLPWHTLKIDTSELEKNILHTLQACGGSHV